MGIIRVLFMAEMRVKGFRLLACFNDYLGKHSKNFRIGNKGDYEFSLVIYWNISKIEVWGKVLNKSGKKEKGNKH